MGALVAVSGIGAERDEGIAHIVAGAHCGVGIRVIVAKYVSLVFDVVVFAQAFQLAQQMSVEGTAGILCTEGNTGLPGVLARGHRPYIDADELHNTFIQ